MKLKPASRPYVVKKLHRYQRLVHSSKARFKVVVAGRRWGKTALSSIELIIAAISKRNSLVWYVAPSYAMARDIMWRQLIESIPRQYLARKPHDTKLELVFKNGSVIQLKGADKPDSLRGRGVDFVVLDEFQDFKEGTWGEVIAPTLADRRGRALVIGTPKAYNELYVLYMKGQNKKENPDWDSYQFPTATSPFIPASELEAARRNLDERTYAQEFEASFETMSGRVYYAFDRHTHVNDKYDFDPSNYIIVGQDFNVDPMCSVILQHKPETGELWAVDEIFLNQSNTQEVVNELERRFWRHFPNKIAVFPDPAGANRSSARGETDVQIFREKGIKRIHHRKKAAFVSDRVNAVNGMLMNAAGEIRLRINPRCKNLIASLEQTLYKPNSREVDKTAGAEHMSDALGYPIEFLFSPTKVKLVGASR